MPFHTRPYKGVLPSKIMAEVNADEGVAPSCLSVSTDEDADLVLFEFDDYLQVSEEDAVNAVYDSHVPTESPLVIESLYAPGQSGDHRVIDYKAGLINRLHKVITQMYRGEVREVKYYTDDTETTLVLVVRICSDADCTSLGYVRNALGAPVERWTERTWYREDTTAHADKKVTKKVYSHDPVAQMTEGLRRRQNQIDKLSVDILQAHVATTAVDPLNPTEAELEASYDTVTAYNDKYEAGITTFVRVGRNDFLTPPDSPNVTDDTETWLDNSVTPIGYPEGWTIRTIVLESVKNISED